MKMDMKGAIMQKSTVVFYLFYLFAGLATIALFDGTGDAGDSITHYLIARYAPQHPMAFFDHWGKPLFTLLAAPWAQFGIVGFKLFNLLVVLLTAYLTQTTARKLGLANSWLVPMLFLFAPLMYILTFSGLTEPLFALVLAAGLLLFARQQLVWAAVVVSFLPFVRSEGLLVIGVFVAAFLYRKHWKAMVATATGHVVYSMAGALAGKPLLWIFTEIPYASATSPYGSGPLFYFPSKLFMVLGLPIMVLFLLGLVVGVYRMVQNPNQRAWLLVVVGSFAAVFLFHTLAWWLGMFNSMGLKRVLLAVMPAMALLALMGFNALTENKLLPQGKARSIAKAVIIAVFVVFPFTENHSAVHWKRDMNLAPDQVMAHEVAAFLRSKATANQRYFCTYNYMCVALDIDYLDTAQRVELCDDIPYRMRKGDIVVWDDWSAAMCSQVDVKLLEGDERLTLLGAFSSSSKEKAYSIKVFGYE
jgi:hypothetical protein